MIFVYSVMEIFPPFSNVSFIFFDGFHPFVLNIKRMGDATSRFDYRFQALQRVQISMRWKGIANIKLNTINNEWNWNFISYFSLEKYIINNDGMEYLCDAKINILLLMSLDVHFIAERGVKDIVLDILLHFYLINLFFFTEFW